MLSPGAGLACTAPCHCHQLALEAGAAPPPACPTCRLLAGGMLCWWVRPQETNIHPSEPCRKRAAQREEAPWSPALTLGADTPLRGLLGKCRTWEDPPPRAAGKAHSRCLWKQGKPQLSPGSSTAPGPTPGQRCSGALAFGAWIRPPSAPCPSSHWKPSSP